MKQKNQRLLPAFPSEAAEAEWWYKNRAQLDKDLVAAAKRRQIERLIATDFDPATALGTPQIPREPLARPMSY